MACTQLRPQILIALITNAEGNIAKAKANIEVYLHNPVGIGEHPDIIAAIQSELDLICQEEERIATVKKHFLDHTHD